MRIAGRVPPWAIVLAAFIAIDVQVTSANLVANKVFAGHDSGFYTYFPNELLTSALYTWEPKHEFGFPSFINVIQLPFAMLVKLISFAHLSMPQTARLYYFIGLLLAEYSAFALAYVVLRRTYPGLGKLVTYAAAFAAAIAGTFNILTVLLFFYPLSTFAYDILLWPLVLACELYYLWFAPTLRWAILLSLGLVIATTGNPGHVLLGIACCAAVFVFHVLRQGRVERRHLAAVAAVYVCGTAYIWGPPLVTALLVHGPVVVREGLDYSSLVQGQAVVAARTSTSALLRWDGLPWFPKLFSFPYYMQPWMIVLGYVPAMFAAYALFARRQPAYYLWALILVGIEFGKGVHGPFGLDMPWLLTHVPGFAAFRVPYDKFVMLILIGLPPAFAMGIGEAISRGTVVLRAVAAAAAVGVILYAWPFTAGRIAEPYYQTTIPSDYAVVDQLLGDDPRARALTFPGAFGDQYVTTWYKGGGNFETLIDRLRIVNAAQFKQRSISAAPLFNDTTLRQARELPEIIDMLPVYGIGFVILHKDFMTEYALAFDREPYKVNGPLLSDLAQRVLDGDSRLTKLFDGRFLALYRYNGPAPEFYAARRVGFDNGFENMIMPVADSGLLGSGAPLTLFAGNQNPADYPDLYAASRTGDYTVINPLIPESKALYQEQLSLQPRPAQDISLAASAFGRRPSYVFAHSHGDYLSGEPLVEENIVGAFDVRSPTTFRVRATLEAEPQPREAFAEFSGAEGGEPWRVGPLSLDAPVDEILNDGPDLPPFAQLTTPRVDVLQAPAWTAYRLRLERTATFDEFVSIDRPLPAVSLRENPSVSFFYEFEDPEDEDAWLRFQIVNAAGRRLFLDTRLVAGQSLTDYSIRDRVQAALDDRYDQFIQSHWYDRDFLERAPYFNPEQADDYRLAGVQLICGKKHHQTLTKLPTVVGMRVRGLQIALAGLAHPAFERVVYQRSFPETPASARTEINLEGVQRSVHDAAAIVTAVVPHAATPLRKSLVGLHVSFALRDGRTVSGDVRSESQDAYLLQVDPVTQQLVYKAAVSTVSDVSKADIGEYIERVDLPRNFSMSAHPRLRVRYWVGSQNEAISVHVGLRTASGVIDVIPGLQIDPKLAVQQSPPEWSRPVSYPGFGTLVALDSHPVEAQTGDTGWRELSCDLRQVASYRASRLQASVAYVALEFTLGSGSAAPANETYAFGLGDVRFVDQETEDRLGTPHGGGVSVDDRDLRLRATTPVGLGSRLHLDLGDVSLGRGRHNVKSVVQPPWRVASIALVDRDVADSAHAAGAEPLDARALSRTTYTLRYAGSGPAWLVFSQTYHPAWRLIRVDRAPQSLTAWVLSFRWLASDRYVHLVGNAYANAWRVPSGSAGTYVVDYLPQDLEILGIAVSALTLLVVIVALVLPRKRTP